MDHVGGIQIKPRRNGCFAYIQRADFLSGRQQTGTGFCVNPRIGTGTHHGTGVGGIDDGIHLHIGNIISYDLKRHLATPFFPFIVE